MYLIEWDFWFPLEGEYGYFDAKREFETYEKNREDIFLFFHCREFSYHKTFTGELILMSKCIKRDMYDI